MGLLDQAQDSAAARAQQEIRAVATKPQPHTPDFRGLMSKMDKLASMSAELERRGESAMQAMFGPVPERDSADEKVRQPEGFVEEANYALDVTFRNLDSLQAMLNKLHIELGTSEDQ